MAPPHGASACPTDTAGRRRQFPPSRGVLMRIASRVIPHAVDSARGYLLVALGVVALGFAGCNDQHIGRPCVTNAPPDAGDSSETTIISSPSLGCPSRICIQPAAMGPVPD